MVTGKRVRLSKASETGWYGRSRTTSAKLAASKHRDQRRKGAEASPYINHPIEVAELLARVGGITDVVTLQAAILQPFLWPSAFMP